MRLADRHAYAAFGFRTGDVPAMVPGRALCARERLELQVVAPRPDLAAAVAAVAGRARRRPPARVDELPAVVPASALAAHARRSTDGWIVPIGLDLRDGGVAGLPLRPGATVVVTGPAHSGRSSVLAVMAAGVAAADPAAGDLRASARARDVWARTRSSPGSAAAVAGWVDRIVAGTGPRLVLLDDADALAGPSFERLAAARDSAITFVVAGTSEGLRSIGHWSRPLLRTRTGVLLAPTAADGDLLRVAVPAGRGRHRARARLPRRRRRARAGALRRPRPWRPRRGGVTRQGSGCTWPPARSGRWWSRSRARPSRSSPRWPSRAPATTTSPPALGRLAAALAPWPDVPARVAWETGPVDATDVGGCGAAALDALFRRRAPRRRRHRRHRRRRRSTDRAHPGVGRGRAPPPSWTRSAGPGSPPTRCEPAALAACRLASGDVAVGAALAAGGRARARPAATAAIPGGHRSSPVGDRTGGRRAGRRGRRRPAVAAASSPGGGAGTAPGTLLDRVRPMRVLMLAWEFPPGSVGGVAAHVDGLSHALAGAGHDVVVFTLAHRLAPLRSEEQGVRVLAGPHRAAVAARGRPRGPRRLRQPPPRPAQRRPRGLAAGRRARPRLGGGVGRRHAVRVARRQARRLVPHAPSGVATPAASRPASPARSTPSSRGWPTAPPR